MANDSTKKKPKMVFSANIGNPWHGKSPDSRRKLALKKKKGKNA